MEPLIMYTYLPFGENARWRVLHRFRRGRKGFAILLELAGGDVDAIDKNFSETDVAGEEETVVGRKHHAVIVRIGRAQAVLVRRNRRACGVAVVLDIVRYLTQLAVGMNRNRRDAPVAEVCHRQHFAGLVDREVRGPDALGRNFIQKREFAGFRIHRVRGDGVSGIALHGVLVGGVEKAVVRALGYPRRIVGLLDEAERRDVARLRREAVTVDALALAAGVGPDVYEIAFAAGTRAASCERNQQRCEECDDRECCGAGFSELR
jgi:hypothetical protein